MRGSIIVSGVLGVLVTAACSTQGGGTGQLVPASATGQPAPSSEPAVSFAWQSEGASVTRGQISATVPGQGFFQGKYMQITSQVDATGATPYFSDVWYPGWGAWDGWGGEVDEFVTNYTGTVVAVLRSAQGTSMRCRFRLAEPASGPAGGGMGECELSDGDKIKGVTLEGSHR